MSGNSTHSLEILQGLHPPLNRREQVRFRKKDTQVRRSTKLRIDGLSYLLAEQVLPHERLLWRGCPDPLGSAAARVNLYRYGGILTVARWRVMSLGAVLAALAFFSTRGSGPPTDDTTTSAGIAAFFTFCLTILACAATYWAVQMVRAGDMRWPTWRWRAVGRLLRLPVPRWWRDNTDPLIEPPAAAIVTHRVIYGLTDQRVIVLVDGPRRSVRSYWLHEITDVRCIDAPDGWGDLALVVEEGALDSEEDEPVCASEWEEIRLWGIERAGCVAEALRCLIARQPLQAAIAALSYGIASAEELGGHGWGDGLLRATLPKARMWQATFWHGSASAQLVPCTIYGSSLAELRRRARERLVALRPPCFSNGPRPPSQDARRPACQLALYLSSGSDALTAEPGPDLLEPDLMPDLPRPQQSQEAEDFAPPRAQAIGTSKIHAASAHTARHRRGSRTRGAQESPQSAGQSGAPGHPSSPPGADSSGGTSQRNSVWRRKARQGDPTAQRDFTTFDEAVAHFVARDLLPERGPAYEDVLLEEGSQWPAVQTVRVVDDEALANELLRRGGWHVMTTMGMTAPRGTRGPVLFVLGHPESGAV